jgi:hypothetical protein
MKDTGVVWLMDLTHWKSPEDRNVCSKAAGSSGIDSFCYLRLSKVELILPMVEVMLVLLELCRVLEIGVVGCLYRTGSCRTFCEEAG